MRYDKKIQIGLGSIIILWILATIGDIFLIQKNETLRQERDRAKLHSDSILSTKLNTDKKFDRLTKSYVQCNINNTEQDSIIKSLQKEPGSKSKNDSGNLKKQLKEAKNQNSKCSEHVNDLLNEVATLEKKIAELNDVFIALKTTNYELASKLDRAMNLKVYDIVVTSYKNAIITQKAKETNRINISFILPENDFVEAGNREINIVIFNPKGQILSLKGNKFYNKTLQKEQVYSDSKTINYTNKDTKALFDIECNCMLDKGTYKLEVYVNKNIAGKKDFTLN